MMKKTAGFTLIELIIFIVIMGIASIAILKTFQTLLKNSPTAKNQTVAIALAQERMEFVLGQKQMIGFTSFNDPCENGSTASICTAVPNTYTVHSTITNTTISGDSNYKTITVTVTGPGNATLTMLVGK